MKIVHKVQTKNKNKRKKKLQLIHTDLCINKFFGYSRPDSIMKY